MEIKSKKSLGAYYTDPLAVDFLVHWAMRGDTSSVMDPSCGDGRFLQAAQDAEARRLIGIDLDSAAVERCRAALQGAGEALLLEADFFSIDPSGFGGLDAIVGNPPFVRYQRFSEASRRLALESALRFGVRLTRLTSTWAPFLLHAAQFLRPGGKLAMVVPAEISQTQYGLPTLRALVGRFASVTLISFEQNIFQDAQADTYLLLAEGYGGRADGVQLLPLRRLDDLAEMSPEENRGLALPIEDGFRFVEAFLSPAERRAWARAKAADQIFALGDLGTITNGYVTGANEFFHRIRSEAVAEGVPSEWLLPVARNGRSFPGLRLALADLEQQEAGGRAHHLVVPDEGLFSNAEALERFASEGETLGTHQRFKCRTRTPWWRVPGLVRADILLTYMAGSWPRAALNCAGALYSNTLHGLRTHPGVDAAVVALMFHSSLTLLSVEVEGRSYGGGILKLEPSEMSRVRVAAPSLEPGQRQALIDMADRGLRRQGYEEIVEEIDRTVMQGVLGLSKYTMSLLRSGRERLLERRRGRARGRGGE